MDDGISPQQPIITNIDDVNTLNITRIDDVINTTLPVEQTTPTAPVVSGTLTSPPSLPSSTQPPNSSITSPRIPTNTTSSVTPLSTPNTGQAPRVIHCPNIFSSGDKGDDDKTKTNGDHHTIIINNRNKAVIFNHNNNNDNNNDDNDSKSIDDNKAGVNEVSLQINTRENTPGAIVTAICSHGSVPLTVTFLECQSDGKWNATLPPCQGSLDVSSKTLYFSMIGSVCGLTIVILVLLYCLMMKTKRRGRGPLPPPPDPDKALYVDPYAVGERLYSIPAPLHYKRGDITYAKPQIYSTYLNPSFYEDAYDRWRRQEQQVSEKLYDSPYLNRRTSQAWPDNQEFSTWRMARGDNSKQLDRLCHIPRAKIASLDRASLRSQDSVSTLTFTGPRPQPQRIVYSRQTSSAMPKYGQGNAPRRQSSQLETPSNLPLVKAFDEGPPPPPLIGPIPDYDTHQSRWADERTPF